MGKPAEKQGHKAMGLKASWERQRPVSQSSGSYDCQAAQMYQHRPEPVKTMEICAFPKGERFLFFLLIARVLFSRVYKGSGKHV